MPSHRNLVPGAIHPIHDFTYADAAARAAAPGLTSADIGRAARQLDNGSFWILKNHSPVTWTSMGGGAGGGSRNLLSFDASYAPLNSDASDFEGSTGGVVAYADAAGTAPVDMTGGSPNSTFTRTTASPLDGLASGLLTLNSGASRQGEGIAWTVNVPPVDRGTTKLFKLPFSTSGTLADGDLKLYGYIIDGSSAGVTKMQEINQILGPKGTAVGAIFIPLDCTQLRLGIHVARTTTGALTVKMDDVLLTSDAAPVGLAGSDAIPYTPATQGLGAPTSVSVTYTRVGGYALIEGIMTLGTTTNVQARIGLPAGLTTASDYVAQSLVGTIHPGIVSSSQFGLLAAPGLNYLTIDLQGGGAGGTGLNPINGSDIGVSGNVLSFFAKVRIAGWAANVTMAGDPTGLPGVLSVRLVNDATFTNTGIIFDDVVSDVYGGYDIGTGNYTVKVGGTYLVLVNGNSSSNSGMFLYKNNGVVATMSDNPTSQSVSGVASVNLVPGDVVKIQSVNTGNWSGGSGGTTGAYTRWTMARVTGNTSADLSKPAFKASLTTGPLSVGTDSPILYDTVTKNTAGSYNPATGVFTSAVAGTAHVNVGFITTATATKLYVVHNGVATEYLTSAASNAQESASVLVDIMSGDTLQINIVTASSGLTGSSGATLTNFWNMIVL